MLVLTRKIEERIVIDDAITIEVLSIQGGRVKLGIVAPSNLRVQREELCRDSENTAPKVSPL